MTGLSYLVPVHNAGPLLRACMRAILRDAATHGTPFEIVLVDDGSTDGAVRDVFNEMSGAPIVCERTESVGAAGALNRGIQLVRYPFIAQVDQDVIVEPGWSSRLLARLEDPSVAAVQGQYVTDPQGSILQRVMGRDLEDRYAALPRETGHVCTGNVIYRASAVREVGGFDDALGYGYDNDMSYRLRAAGYRLEYCAEARSLHCWRETLAGYCRQQYGFGYGRIDLVAKHRGRFGGDSVSPPMMMLHPVLMAVVLGLTTIAAVVRGEVAAPLMATAGGLASLLIAERTVAGVRAARRSGDWVPLLFPLAHMVRDAAWVAAIVMWSGRRTLGRALHPRHSMKPRRSAFDALIE